MWKILEKRLIRSWKSPVKLFMRRYSNCSSLQYMGRRPWIAEDKTRILFYFILGSTSSFKKILLLRFVTLSQGHFCDTFVIFHFYPLSLNVKLLDSSSHMIMSSYWGSGKKVPTVKATMKFEQAFSSKREGSVPFKPLTWLLTQSWHDLVSWLYLEKKMV